MEQQASSPTPILGSLLLKAALSNRNRIPKSASSGSSNVDNLALQGGFRYGEITSIAGAHGTGKTTIAFHAVASHLLGSRKGEVAIIDTSGTFSPVRLRDVLAVRLRDQRQRTTYHQSGYVYTRQPPEPEPVTKEVVQEATSMLDRVKVMRVFDVAGLIEAVSEVAEICEQGTDPDVEKGVRRRVAVADSEDGLSGDEDRADSGDSEEPVTEDPAEESGPQNDDIMLARDERIGMVLIDTIANIFGPLISKSQVQDQALLASFMRSVGHLTMGRQICTILINAVVGLGSSKYSQYQRRYEDDVSIFSSVTGKPALGKSFTYLIDTSIMLSTMPKTKEDANFVYADNSEGRQAHCCGIIEVLHDRNATRAECWAAFEVVDGVDIKSIHVGGT